MSDTDQLFSCTVAVLKLSNSKLNKLPTEGCDYTKILEIINEQEERKENRNNKKKN